MEVTPVLHLVTCGSVDDGKSTLIGRLLAETDSVPVDQLEYALRAVLALTCDADGNRVFDDADHDALAAQPVADGVITRLTTAFAELVGGSGDLGKD